MARKKAKKTKTTKSPISSLLKELDEIEKAIQKTAGLDRISAQTKQKKIHREFEKVGIYPEELTIMKGVTPIRRSALSVSLDARYHSPFIIPRSVLHYSPTDTVEVRKIKDSINTLIRQIYQQGKRQKAIIGGLDVVSDKEYPILIQEAVKYIGTGNSEYFNTYTKGIPKRDKNFMKRYRSAIRAYLKMSDAKVNPFHKKLVGLWLFLKLRPTKASIRKDLMDILAEIDAKITELAKKKKRKKRKKTSG